MSAAIAPAGRPRDSAERARRTRAAELAATRPVAMASASCWSSAARREGSGWGCRVEAMGSRYDRPTIRSNDSLEWSLLAFLLIFEMWSCAI